MCAGGSRCLYGVAGWAYEDWQGVVYPKPRPRGFDPIAYLARFFDVLEIDSSFYRIPDPRSTERWARAAAPFRDFEFTMKLYQGFTHSGPGAPWNEAEAGAFEEAAARLHEAGKLGCVLMQFPWSFRAEVESRDRLTRLLDRFSVFPLAVEVRHSSWLDDKWLFETLKERGAAFCNIDQPPLRQCIGLTAHATAPHAYLRFHGRNAKNWFRESASGAERYDYLYSQDEIRQLVEAVKALKRKAKRVHVITNNHWRGQAAANALQIKAAAEGGTVKAPATLIQQLGELGPGIVAEKSEGGEQMEMF